MKNKKVFLTLLLVLLFSVCAETSMAFDIITHKELNENVTQRTINGFSLDNYLINNLGFKAGIKEKIIGLNAEGKSSEQFVYEWLGYGGIQEDKPEDLIRLVTNRARNNNHFHNPLKTWDKAGLSDVYTGQSMALWAQNLNQDKGGHWSWQDARKYFYIALTGSDFNGNIVASTKTERDRYFADTFRAVGQQLHLVQDAAVPEHVRNDLHVFPAFEAKVAEFRTNSSLWRGWLSQATGFDKTVFSLPPNLLASIPSAKVIDTDKYTLDAPNPGITTNFDIGIAEYTNANFASPDTIFAEDKSTTDKHYFPYPKKASTDVQNYISQNKLPETVMGEDNKPDTAFWIAKTGYGEKYGHFAKPGYFTNYDAAGVGTVYNRTFILDDECYKDYAALLIPRAVGYSAGLLDYFFRGDIDIVPDDATGFGYVIVNNSDEDMEGTFELWYDNKNDERVKLQSWSLTIGKKSKSTNLTFSAPADVKEPDKYTLVFKGKFGGEQDAVVGKEINLIPLLIFLHNGQNTLFMAFDKDLKLTPYPPFTLTFGNAGLSGIETSPATIQSNKTFTEHYYMPSTTQNKKLSSANFQKYGRLSYSSGKAYLLGNRNSFAPTGWEKTSPLQYNADLSYLSYKTSAPAPYYISSGRHDWVYRNDSIIKNLEAWKETDNKPHIRYTTKDGVVKGNALPFSEVYAALSPDKVIGISSDTSSRTSSGIGGYDDFTTCNWGGWKYKRPAGSFHYEQGGHKFYCGNVMLDYVDTNYSYVDSVNKIQCACSRPSNIFYDLAQTHYVYETRGLATFAVKDYDYINDDEIFIVMYTKTGSGYKGEGTVGDSVYNGYGVGMSMGPPSHYKTQGGTMQSYHIAYQPKAGGLHQQEICYTINGTIETVDFVGDPCDSTKFEWSPEDPGTWPPGWVETVTRTPQQFQGQAMFNPSTKIFDFNGRTYIAYSYSIYDYIGDPSVANFDSELSSDWRFNKRIVGLIDAATGQKSETEITDFFLGNMYKDKFDKMLYSAIGFHNGSMKKQE